MEYQTKVALGIVFMLVAIITIGIVMAIVIKPKPPVPIIPDDHVPSDALNNSPNIEVPITIIPRYVDHRTVADDLKPVKYSFDLSLETGKRIISVSASSNTGGVASVLIGFEDPDTEQLYASQWTADDALVATWTADFRNEQVLGVEAKGDIKLSADADRFAVLTTDQEIKILSWGGAAFVEEKTYAIGGWAGQVGTDWKSVRWDNENNDFFYALTDGGSFGRIELQFDGEVAIQNTNAIWGQQNGTAMTVVTYDPVTKISNVEVYNRNDPAFAYSIVAAKTYTSGAHTVVTGTTLDSQFTSSWMDHDVDSMTILEKHSNKDVVRTLKWDSDATEWKLVHATYERGDTYRQRAFLNGHYRSYTHSGDLRFSTHDEPHSESIVDQVGSHFDPEYKFSVSQDIQGGRVIFCTFVSTGDRIIDNTDGAHSPAQLAVFTKKTVTEKEYVFTV